MKPVNNFKLFQLSSTTCSIILLKVVSIWQN